MITNDDFRKYDYPKGLTITDPPYNQSYRYSSYKDNLKLDEYIELLKCIKTPCVIIHYPEETINILSKCFDNCEQVVTWVYNSNTGKQSRTISWWGCKPDFTKVLQPFKNPNDKRIKSYINRTGKNGAKLYDWWEVQQVKNTSKQKTEHPCQIPEEIIKRIILTTAKNDEIIIDPFAGSGTTLKVAKELGYSYIGYEIDENYINIIKNRLQTL
jgi:site-specific DNA-methyltransferase (adenine-specific)